MSGLPAESGVVLNLGAEFASRSEADVLAAIPPCVVKILLTPVDEREARYCEQPESTEVAVELRKGRQDRAPMSFSSVDDAGERVGTCKGANGCVGGAFMVAASTLRDPIGNELVSQIAGCQSDILYRLDKGELLAVINRQPAT